MSLNNKVILREKSNKLSNKNASELSSNDLSENEIRFRNLLSKVKKFI